MTSPSRPTEWFDRSETSAARRPMVEWELLAPIRSNFWLLLFTGCVAMGATALWVQNEERVYPVRSELLLRFGYEYSPPPTNLGSDNTQVDVDQDEAIGTEMQILTGVALVQKTLEMVPYPIVPEDPAAEPPLLQQLRDLAMERARETVAYPVAIAEPPEAGPPVIEDILKKIALRRIEGSNVLRIEMIDPNEAWALRFLEAHMENYLAERRRLFSNDEYRLLLTNRLTSYWDIYRVSQEEIGENADRAGAAFRAWAVAMPTLVLSEAAQPEVRALVSAFTSLRLRLASHPELANLVPVFDEATASAARNTASEAYLSRGWNPSAVARPSAFVTEAEIKELEDGLKVLRAYLDTAYDLELARQRSLERIAQIETTIARLEIRDVADRRVEVLTPPYVSNKAAGLSAKAKIALAGIVGFLFAAAIAIITRGNKRVAVPPPGDQPVYPAVQDQRRLRA